MNKELTTIEEKALALVDNDNDDPDFVYVRNNIKKLIDDGQLSLDTLRNLADQSQSPRAYEVLHNFMRMMLEANRDLLATKHSKADLDEKTKPQRRLEGAPKVQNNLFVGSTAELQRFLQGKTIDGDKI